MSQIRRYIIIALVTTLLSSTAVFADSYLLTMSKNDLVCQHMYKLFNSDLYSDSGKLLLERHEEFNRIKWDSNNFNAKRFGGWYVGAQFDINNDGNDEIVFFRAKHSDPNVDDHLSYWPLSLKQEIMENSWRPILYDKKSNPLFLGQTFYTYQMAEYPVQKKIDYPYLGIKKLNPQFNTPYIRPFFWTGKYYIALIGNVVLSTMHSDTVDDKDSIVIQQFIPENQTKDLCYFIKITDNRPDQDMSNLDQNQ